jgi:hypothetical protein
MPTVLRIVAVSLLLAATASEAREGRPRLEGAIVFGKPTPIGRCQGVVIVKRFNKDEYQTRPVNPPTRQIFRSCLGRDTVR